MGTAVLLPMLRNPVLLARSPIRWRPSTRSAKDALSWVSVPRETPPAIRMEFEAAGVPFEKRIGRMIEEIQLCRALWSGEKIDWEGRWTVKRGQLAPKPFTAGGPPLWGGGGVPGALERAGTYFDGWFPSGPGTPR